MSSYHDDTLLWRELISDREEGDLHQGQECDGASHPHINGERNEEIWKRLDSRAA